MPNSPSCPDARPRESDSFDLIDEGIHLTSAFQLAGFPHVIGSLWPIGDRTAAVVASTFYSVLQSEPRILNVNASARALPGVIRLLRADENNAATPSVWAAFIHVGG